MPVLKVKVIVLCASARVQGATLHWFFALSATPLRGTVTPSSGIANVCEARSGFKIGIGLPLTFARPMIPSGRPQNGLRRPVAVSYWRIVTWTSEFAGTSRTVLCTHLPCGSLTRYETQSGCGPKPIEATVCSVRLAFPGVPLAAIAGGITIRYETM